MDREPLAQCRVAITSKGLQPVDEVDLSGGGWEVERVPCELGRADVHFGVDGEKGGFELCIGVDVR